MIKSKTRWSNSQTSKNHKKSKSWQKLNYSNFFSPKVFGTSIWNPDLLHLCSSLDLKTTHPNLQYCIMYTVQYTFYSHEVLATFIKRHAFCFQKREQCPLEYFLRGKGQCRHLPMWRGHRSAIINPKVLNLG